MWRAALLALLPVLLGVSLTGCGGGGLPDGLKVLGAVGHQPTVTIPKKAPGGKLAVKTLHKGKGAAVSDGDLVVANYVGYRWNGTGNKLVANSYDSGRPAMFPYGNLVTGLNKAFQGQRAGGRVMAVIPPSQGYGTTGMAQLQVGASDSLVFVLDVIASFPNAATAKGQAQPQNDPKLPKVTAASAPTMTVPKTAPPGGLQVKTLIQGTGPQVQTNQLVVFHDIGQTWRDGHVFEASRKDGRPDSVVVGARQMIAGWDRAVIGRPVGSRILVVIPPKDGYGSKGHPSAGIKSGDTLAFVIDILAAY